MKIQVCMAYVVTEEKKVRLTKAVAKQFPIFSGSDRARALEQGIEQSKPLGKVMGQTLSKPWTWLYLLADEVSGYAWVGVNELHPDYVKSVLAHGGLVENPADVPLIVL